MPELKPKPFPKTFGACADLLSDLREKRLLKQKEVEKMEAEESRLTLHIINGLPKTDTGAKGKHHQVSVVTKRKLRVVSWDEFHAFVKKKNLFHLLQKRLSEPAVEELIEQTKGNKLPPGVEAINVVTLSLRKV